MGSISDRADAFVRRLQASRGQNEPPKLEDKTEALFQRLLVRAQQLAKQRRGG